MSRVKKNKEPIREQGERLSTREKWARATDVTEILGKARVPIDREELAALGRNAKRSRTAAEVNWGLDELLRRGTAVEKDGKFCLAPSKAWLSGTAVGTRAGSLFFEPDEDAGDVEYVFKSGAERLCFPGDRVLVSRKMRDSRGRVEVELQEE